MMDYNKEQLQKDAVNVDKQVGAAAAAVGTNKLIMYGVGLLALVGIAAVIKWLL